MLGRSSPSRLVMKTTVLFLSSARRWQMCLYCPGMFWCTKRYFMNGDPKTDDRRKGGAPFPDCHCRARPGNPCQRRHPDSPQRLGATAKRSEEHTSELQSLMRISYAFFCLKKKTRPQ